MSGEGQQASQQFLVFALGERRFALPVTAVERVLRAAAVTPLPGGPPGLLGALNVHGRVLPVADLRRCLRLPSQPLQAENHLLLLRVAGARILVLVDRVLGLEDASAERLRETAGLFPSALPIRGALPGPDDIMLIYDPEALLGHEVGPMLGALAKAAEGPHP